ncbi:MAG: hypothetical protein F7C38_06275 [Desulfurococcales archaeon]|nr:hypothetical protein [Desulfurococcales archaeon]
MELPKEVLDKLSQKLAAESKKTLERAEEKLEKKYNEFVNEIKKKGDDLVREFSSKLA